MLGKGMLAGAYVMTEMASAILWRGNYLVL